MEKTGHDLLEYSYQEGAIGQAAEGEIRSYAFELMCMRFFFKMKSRMDSPYYCILTLRPVCLE